MVTSRRGDSSAVGRQDTTGKRSLVGQRDNAAAVTCCSNLFAPPEGSSRIPALSHTVFAQTHFQTVELHNKIAKSRLFFHKLIPGKTFYHCTLLNRALFKLLHCRNKLVQVLMPFHLKETKSDRPMFLPDSARKRKCRAVRLVP
jgi:hypothetical protein